MVFVNSLPPILRFVSVSSLYGVLFMVFIFYIYFLGGIIFFFCRLFIRLADPHILVINIFVICNVHFHTFFFSRVVFSDLSLPTRVSRHRLLHPTFSSLSCFFNDFSCVLLVCGTSLYQPESLGTVFYISLSFLLLRLPFITHTTGFLFHASL